VLGKLVPSHRPYLDLSGCARPTHDRAVSPIDSARIDRGGNVFASSRLILVAWLLIGVVPIPPAQANPFEYDFHELAPGVWAAVREDPFELPQEGNALFVVTTEGVVLFDAGGSPLMGAAIVAKVQSITAEPITHVVISHWHGDHMRGLQAIRAAFPAAQVITHPHSREMIVTTRERWLKRRVIMVGNIRSALGAALAKDQDLSGRPLIPAERAWLEKGLTITDQLDSENQRTDYVIPNVTFAENMTLFLGGREIRLLHPGNAHTAGDLMLWLPHERILATGDIVTAPIPLMPSPYTRDYVGVLASIKSLDFSTLLPGHGSVQKDAQYLDLLSDTFATANEQMKAYVAQGISQDEATKKIDFSKVEPRFTHGDAFLANRFADYVADALPDAAYAVANGKVPEEKF